MAGPSSIQWLGQNHVITTAMMTGIEVHRCGSLNDSAVKGPARQHLDFWPLPDGLPPGSVLALSDLQDEREMHAMFSGCTAVHEDLRSHPCMRGTPRANQLNLMHRISRQPTTLRRRRAGFAGGHPKAAGVRLGRHDWVPSGWTR